MKTLLFIPLIVLATGLPFTGNWNADSSKAKITFAVDGPFGEVHGSFSGLSSEIQFDEKDLSKSSVTASIDAGTVNSGIGFRNTHLRNEEQWLNTAKYPRIHFKSTKIEKTPGGYSAYGTLMLKNISKSIVIPFTFSSTGNTGVFKGRFSIKREDYNLGKKGGSVGETIQINIEVPVKSS
ncbi:MAG TPA: YceI family protein [Puia sp.]|jgi:polyisoprenoid-binding protein YceI